MTALPNPRHAAPEPARRHDIHEAYWYLMDLERRAEINIAICENRQVRARHQSDMQSILMLIDIIGKIIDQRGECRTESLQRRFRARAQAELLERLR